MWELLTDVNKNVSKPRTQVNNYQNKICDFTANAIGSKTFNQSIFAFPFLRPVQVQVTYAILPTYMMQNKSQ